MKKIMTICLVMAVAASLVSAGIVNGGFESGDLTGWTTQYTNDGSNWGFTNQAPVTKNTHYSGSYALSGYADIYGDNSGWPDEDWARTYVWSDSQNLSSVTSVQLYLTNFISNYSLPGWGFGQEVFLMLSDGANSSSVLLIDNHEHPYATSLVEAGAYTLSTGNDGNTWYRFDVALNTTGFGAGINLSSAKVGICWEAISWYDAPLTLWAGAVVDDIQLIPEPATIAILSIGALSLIRRKKH